MTRTFCNKRLSDPTKVFFLPVQWGCGKTSLMKLIPPSCTEQRPLPSRFLKELLHSVQPFGYKDHRRVGNGRSYCFAWSGDRADWPLTMAGPFFFFFFTRDGRSAYYPDMELFLQNPSGRSRHTRHHKPLMPKNWKSFTATVSATGWRDIFNLIAIDKDYNDKRK